MSKQIDLTEEKLVKLTKCGIGPHVKWWKDAWKEAELLACGSDIGLVGITIGGGEAHFQVRGTNKVIIVDLDV